MLVRGFGFWLAVDCGGIDERIGFERDGSPPAAGPLGRVFAERAEGLLEPATLARLGDLEGSSSFLAADDCVGAVAAAGRRTGRVGDRGRGLVAGVAFRLGGPVADVCRDFGAAAVDGFAAVGACRCDGCTVFLGAPFVKSLRLLG